MRRYVVSYKLVTGPSSRPSHPVTCPSGRVCAHRTARHVDRAAWVWLDFPLEEGKTWSPTSIISGETFIAEVAYQYKVEGVEKITTRAGQFDAYRISGSERIKSRSKRGQAPGTVRQPLRTALRRSTAR